MNYIEMFLIMATAQARNGGAGEYFTIPNVIDLSGASRSTVNRYLIAFQARGLIYKRSRGKYCLGWTNSLVNIAVCVTTPMELYGRQASFQRMKKESA